MNLNFKSKFFIVSRYSILVIIIQFFTSVGLMAHASVAKDLDEVYVSVEWRDIELEKGLRELENKTGFRFLYKDADLKEISRVSLEAKNKTLKDVLMLLSKENHLKFKRLNNTISVIKQSGDSNEPFVIELNAEDFTVTGKVIDENGEGIPNVTIIIKGTTQGTVTKLDGTYQISVPSEESVLVFSFVGYTTEEVQVGKQSVIDMMMLPDIQSLSEIVVVGYGTMEKREVAGSISSVDFENIEHTSAMSFDKVLQGRSPGVQIVNGGAPGGTTQVRIRGIGSISSGNQPLYIVDGVQVVQGEYGEAGGGQENVLASINPNDIVSVEILKDASASIYGAQAANGVIIVTTKRGETGDTQYNFNAHWGVNRVINKLDMLTGPEWTELVLEGYANRYGKESQQYQDQLAFLGKPEDAPTYDWQDLLFQDGIIQNYQLSARGGNEATKFFISGSYNNSKGHVVGTGFQRGTLRVNLDNQLSNRLKSNLSVNLSHTNSDATRGDGFWFNNPTIASAFIVPTNAPYEEDGSIREPLFGLYTENPLVNKDPSLFDETTTNYKVLTSYSLKYQIIEDLVFESNWAIDFLNNNYSYFGSPKALVAASVEGSVYKSNNRSLNWQTDQTLTYSKEIGQHKLNGLIGVSYRQQKLDYFYASGTKLSSSKLNALGTAATPSVGGNESEWRLAGMFGRINYVLKDKYILSGTIRRDGSSRFGKNNKWGTFPAVSAAWRIGNESFMSSIDKIVSDLKLRGSYGITGNANINNFVSRGFFSADRSFLGSGALSPWTVENDRLSWEQSEVLNVGVDAYFLDSRISITGDYFIRNTNDLLLERPIPATSGYTTVWENIGEVQNKGLELDISTVNIDHNGFKWSTGFNLTKVDNKVLALSGETDQIIDGPVITKVGESITSWYAIRYAGVNPADGRPLYLDKNGELTFHPTADDRVVVGGSLPTYFGGFTNDFSYKGLSLTVFFQYSGGNYLFNQLGFSTKASGGFADRNQQRSELDRWQKPGDITDVPIAWNGFTYDARPGNSYSSRLIEKGDYVRLKQVNLSYSVPSSLLEKLKIRSLSIYASGNNLWTSTPYSGRDPEILGGNETGDYPQARSYIVGIDLGF